MSTPANETLRAAASGRGVRTFISYAREDRPFVDKLVEGLTRFGCDVFLDRKDILPGEPWQRRLSQLILQADTVIFVITAHSIASEVCTWEISEAERLSKRLVPLLREPIDPSKAPGVARFNFLPISADD